MHVIHNSPGSMWSMYVCTYIEESRLLWHVEQDITYRIWMIYHIREVYDTYNYVRRLLANM